MDRERPTLQTIADAVGVHRSTVSRALNPEQAHHLSAETIHRIRAEAERLGWERNPWARSLATNRSLTIGLLIPRLSDPVMATIFEAAEDQARLRGYQALTVSTHDEPHEGHLLAKHLLERRVDGMILATAHLDDPTPDHLADEGVPFVLLNRAQGDHPCVRSNDELGGYLVTRHLLAQGHRRIGIVAGPSTVSTAVQRKNGYLRAHESLGVPVSDELVGVSTFRADGGARVGAELLSLRDRPTAIFAVNDATAIGVMAAARDLGIAIPDQLALVGYNNSEIASLLPTPLSSVHIPLHDMGTTAVDTLLERIDGHETPPTIFTPRLIIRASSDRPIDAEIVVDGHVEPLL